MECWLNSAEGSVCWDVSQDFDGAAWDKVMKEDLENKGSGVTKLVARYTDELREKSLQLDEKTSILKRCVSFRTWTQASQDMETAFEDRS